MNGKTKFRFDFNKVGQGLFYSGNIDGFNFVYDCGSTYTRKLGRSIIGPYKRRLGKKSLDMVVLSHFHDDHTNGLQLLLKGLTVEYAIIPYFTPIERLIMSVRREKFPGWYYNFLRNPVSFLLGNGAKKIIIIGGEKGTPGLPPHSIAPSTIRIDTGHLPPDRSLVATIMSNDPSWGPLISSDVLVKNHDGYITVLGEWVFRFFNYNVETRKSGRILADFKKFLISQGIAPANPNSIRRTITHAPSRKKIREYYERELSIDLNNSSLVMYHGPIGDDKNDLYVHCERGLSSNGCPHLYSCIKKGPCHYLPDEMGQLLTGDIGLKNRAKYSEFKKHYDKYLETIFLSQIPHHGARSSWNNVILHDMKECSHWVASSGRPSFFGHPHSMVVLDILSNERCFCWSNQHNRFFIM
jgi:hypothetical protein